ncbi:MAG: hypothetical protein ACI83B_003413 [Sediminicola sp.]|jgi:hypothetical protein
MKVYKYLPVSEGSKAILVDGTLKFSSKDDFNDPFDCITTYDIEGSMDYLESRKDIILAASKHLKLSPSQRIEQKRKMYYGIKNSIASGEFHKGVIGRVGICCFSNRADNILMWSHYAKNHTGFVIEFNVNPNDPAGNMSNVEKKLIGYDVIYQDNMPIIKAGTRDFDAVKSVFLTKSTDWTYEQEYRVLTTEKGPGIHAYDINLVNRIIAGVKMSPSDYQDLCETVSILANRLNKTIPIVKAEMDHGVYSLKTT